MIDQRIQIFIGKRSRKYFICVLIILVLPAMTLYLQSTTDNSTTRYRTNVQTTSNENYKTITNKGRSFRVQTKEFKDDKNMILIVNTLGRSGSSWISELLSLIDNETFFAFEPLLITKILNETRGSHRFPKILSDIFMCQAENTLIDLEKEWPRVLAKTRSNCGSKCKTINDFNEVCRQSKSIVIKVIRLDLSEVEKFLSSKRTQHMKIIYLVRDPRAQIHSRSMHLMRGYDHSIISDCQAFNGGLLSFHKLSRLYPGHFYFLRYEDMSRNPIGEAEKMWKFLKTDREADLPDSWTKYIEQHNKSPKSASPFSTQRDGSTEWYLWRKEFDPQSLSLTSIEKECKTLMAYAGYIPLNTIENMRDLNINVLSDMNCEYLNCWSFQF